MTEKNWNQSVGVLLLGWCDKDFVGSARLSGNLKGKKTTDPFTPVGGVN